VNRLHDGYFIILDFVNTGCAHSYVIFISRLVRIYHLVRVKVTAMSYSLLLFLKYPLNLPS